MIIESQQQRLVRLEKINIELEYRLEDQAKQSMAVETECVTMEVSWRNICEQKDAEIAKLQKGTMIYNELTVYYYLNINRNYIIAFEVEKKKGNRLREHLSRTEKELYAILQRKYELMRGPAHVGKNSNRALGIGNTQDGNTGNGDVSGAEQGRRGSGFGSWLEFSNLELEAKKNNAQTLSQESKYTRERRVAKSISDFLGFM